MRSARNCHHLFCVGSGFGCVSMNSDSVGMFNVIVTVKRTQTDKRVRFNTIKQSYECKMSGLHGMLYNVHVRDVRDVRIGCLMAATSMQCVYMYLPHEI